MFRLSPATHLTIAPCRKAVEELRKERERLRLVLEGLIAARAKGLPPLQTEDASSIRLLRATKNPVKLLTRQLSFQDVYV